MEKNVKISILCELYGKMLTEKQYTFIDDYYNNDLSLSEIAENNNITRQAVRDVIKQAENKLFEFEEKLQFMNRMREQEKIISSIKKDVQSIRTSVNNSKTKEIIKNIEDKINKLV